MMTSNKKSLNLMMVMPLFWVLLVEEKQTY